MYTFGQAELFNPPDFWTTMATDPTQPPVMLYPYGGGGYSPYGPYPGAWVGQRTFTQADALRNARERQKFMEHRAAVSSDPSHKYLTAEGRLNPKAARALARAKAQQTKREDPIKKIQKRLVATVLIGAVLSTLLK